ncbi:MAG TPA: succinate dehydrogenase assembly factor 2 [Rudaea sp.]|jgi:antitoxin CptB|nr:succinate dehydrogenase assembly factor 2 [Rudaea sp.]
MNANTSRLRWRCRRGMRELDQLLGWYLDSRYAGSDDAAKEAFSTLLDQQDPELWDWLMGRTQPGFEAWRRIVDEIRTRDRV